MKKFNELNELDEIRLLIFLKCKLTKKVKLYNTVCDLNLMGLNENNKLQFDTLHNCYLITDNALTKNVHCLSNAECCLKLDRFFIKNAKELYTLDGCYDNQPKIKITLDCDTNGYGYYFDLQDEFCTNNIFYIEKSDNITQHFLYEIGNLLAFDNGVTLDTNIY